MKTYFIIIILTLSLMGCNDSNEQSSRHTTLSTNNYNNTIQNKPDYNPVETCLYIRKVREIESFYYQNSRTIYELSARLDTFLSYATNLSNIMRREQTCYQEIVKLDRLIRQAGYRKNSVDIDIRAIQEAQEALIGIGTAFD